VNIFTKPGPNYLQPTEEDLYGAECKLNTDWSPDEKSLIVNLANLISGGEMTTDFISVLAERDNDRLGSFLHLQGFKQFVDLERDRLLKVPGSSPIAKSNLLMHLANRAGPSEADNNSARPLRLKRVLDQLEEQELLNSSVSTRDAAKQFELNGRVKKMLCFSGRLKSIDLFRIDNRVGKPMANVDGRFTTTRRIAGIEESHKVGSRLYALPRLLRLQQIVTRQPTIRERVSYQEKKQDILALLDNSGSMSNDMLIVKAMAVLQNRIDALKAGHARLHFAVFAEDMGRVDEILPEKADAFMKDLFEKSMNEGWYGPGTNIHRSLAAAVEWMENRKSTEAVENLRPEILLITDADDTVTMELDELRGNKLHSFLVSEYVSDTVRHLLRLSRASGGVGMHIPNEE
jgi:hypothetical protein